MAELSSCDRDHLAHKTKNTYYLALYWKLVCWPQLYKRKKTNWKHIQPKQDYWNRQPKINIINIFEITIYRQYEKKWVLFKEPLEMLGVENIIVEMKNTLDEIITRLDSAEEWI